MTVNSIPSDYVHLNINNGSILGGKLKCRIRTDAGFWLNGPSLVVKGAQFKAHFVVDL